MEYGTVIKMTRTRPKHGVLRFKSTKKVVKFTPKEMEEFDDWVRMKIMEYGGKLPKVI